MLKKLMITTAITGLMIGTAVAAEGNSMSPAPSATPAPAATPATPAPAAKSTEMIKPAAAPTTTAEFVHSQKPDQFLASKFKGTDVIGSDNQKIGDVSDILFDKDGKIEAYVVGVGGFLGIGSKDVAMAPNAFTVVAGDKSKNEADKLKVSMTKDQLKEAANFEPYKAPSTTGSGGSMGSRANGGMGAARPAVPAPAAK